MFIREVKYDLKDLRILCSSACTEKTLKEFHGLSFVREGLYLSENCYVEYVVRDKRPMSQFMVYTIATLAPKELRRAHPYCEDTNWTRIIAADYKAPLRKIS